MSYFIYVDWDPFVTELTRCRSELIFLGALNSLKPNRFQSWWQIVYWLLSLPLEPTEWERNGSLIVRPRTSFWLSCLRCRHLLAWGWDLTLGAFAATVGGWGLTYVCFNDYFKSVSYLLYHFDIRLYCIPSLSLRDSGLDTRVFRSNHAERFCCLLSENKWDQIRVGIWHRSIPF